MKNLRKIVFVLLLTSISFNTFTKLTIYPKDFASGAILGTISCAALIAGYKLNLHNKLKEKYNDFKTWISPKLTKKNIIKHSAITGSIITLILLGKYKDKILTYSFIDKKSGPRNSFDQLLDNDKPKPQDSDKQRKKLKKKRTHATATSSAVAGYVFSDQQDCDTDEELDEQNRQLDEALSGKQQLKTMRAKAAAEESITSGDAFNFGNDDSNDTDEDLRRQDAQLIPAVARPASAPPPEKYVVNEVTTYAGEVSFDSNGEMSI